MTTRQQASVVSTLKEWASPFLMSALGMLIWHDVSETRSDLKVAVTAMTEHRVRIDQLERDVNMLKTYHYAPAGRSTSNHPYPGDTVPLLQYALLDSVRRRLHLVPAPIYPTLAISR